MKDFYINLETWGTNDPRIISDEVMQEAERGNSYINPDDYIWLCEAESGEAAEAYYWEHDFAVYCFDRMAERCHP